MNFEEANKEIENIISKLEGGTTLKEGLALFERATELTKICYAHLDEAKGKIVTIKETLEGIIEE